MEAYTYRRNCSCTSGVYPSLHSIIPVFYTYSRTSNSNGTDETGILGFIFRYILPILIAIPTALITYYVLVFILQFKIGIKGIITHLPRQQTFYQYIISLGPLLFSSLISVFFIRSIVKVPLLRLIFIWAYLPLLLFFLPDINLPINTWRLFQTYQHIPLAILTAYGLAHIVRRFNKSYIPILILCICLVGYGTGIYIYSYAQSIK